MPYKYVLELVADYLAAGKTYNGSKFSYLDEYLWWLDYKDSKKIHEDTKRMITIIFELLANKKIAEPFKTIKRLTY